MLNKLKFGLKNSSGRNINGRITSFHRGSGCKNKYRLINYSYSGTPFFYLSKEYDPNRNCFIFLVSTADGFLSYILGPSINNSNNSDDYKYEGAFSDFVSLESIKIGSFIYGLESRKNSGSVYIRSAGCFGIILGSRFHKYILVKMPSGILRLFKKSNRAFIGIVSNRGYNLINYKNAGESRRRNKRPIVRGVAMNPIDHPHGGGESKSSGGRPSVSP